MAHVVAIQHIGVLSFCKQAFFQQVGQRGLARARQSGQPYTARCLVLLRCPRRLVQFQCLPMNVVGTAQGKLNHAGTHRLKRQLVDQDETTQSLVGGIRLKHQRRAG